MRRSLLDMVQEILSDMDSDEVESIDDTMESEQVATIIKSTYYAMMSNRNWPHLRRSIQIEPYSDPAIPTHMKIQDTIKELCFLNYDKAKAGDTKKKFDAITYLPPDQFVHKTNQENSDSSEVLTVTDPGGIGLLIRKDRAPTYYTSFDDETLIFDSYDSEVDSTLQESKVQAQAYVLPVWGGVEDEDEDMNDFIPDLPDDAFTALVEEAKSRSSLKLRQVADQKAEQESGKQSRWLARKARRVSGGIQYPSYGRK